MLGPTLALMVRSLRVDARLMRGHLFRLLLIVLIYAMLAIAQDSPFGAPGLRFFTSIGYINALAITLAGCSYFATAITEEKDEFTLGLLKMTGMGPLAILLGKSTSRLITACLALSLQLPFTLLAITLGGVTLVQITAVYEGLFAYLFLLANFGLFCSVISRNSHRAALLVVRVLWMPLLLAPLARWFVRLWITLTPSRFGLTFAYLIENVAEWACASTVFESLSIISQTGYAGSDTVRFQIGSNIVLGLFFFAVSWALFETCTRREPEVDQEKPSLLRFRNRGARTSRRAWRNPFVWKEFVLLTGGLRGVRRRSLFFALAALISYGVFLAGFIIFGQPRDSNVREYAAVCVMTIAAAAGAIELCVYVSRVFGEEIRARTLPLLAMLPVRDKTVWRSKVAGCLLGVFPAVCCFPLAAWIERQGFLDVYHSVAHAPYYWLLVLLFVLLLHLIAYFSLTIAHGAIPIAVVLLAFGCAFTEIACVSLLNWTFGYGVKARANYLTDCFFRPTTAIAAGFCLESMITPRLPRTVSERYPVRAGSWLVLPGVLYLTYPWLAQTALGFVVLSSHLILPCATVLVSAWGTIRISEVLALSVHPRRIVRWGATGLIFLGLCAIAIRGTKWFDPDLVGYDWDQRRPQDAEMMILTIVITVWLRVLIARTLREQAEK